MYGLTCFGYEEFNIIPNEIANRMLEVVVMVKFYGISETNKKYFTFNCKVRRLMIKQSRSNRVDIETDKTHTWNIVFHW